MLPLRNSEGQLGLADVIETGNPFIFPDKILEYRPRLSDAVRVHHSQIREADYPHYISDPQFCTISITHLPLSKS
jgi:hypothetical protein